MAPELEALHTFKYRLSDSLALTLAKCINLEDALLDALNDEQVLANLSTTEKERLLGRVTIAKGVAYDKWRLQTGQVTNKFAHEIQVNIVHQQLDYYSTPEHLRVEAKADGDGGPAGR